MSIVKRRLVTFSSLLFVLALVVMVALPAPGLATTYPLTRTDDLGREVTISAVPERIVSLAPSNTEVLFALGLEDKVVGVTPYCNYPEVVVEKEGVGGPQGKSIEIERIIALQPDLILAAEINGMDVINALEELGFPVFAMKSTDLGDVLGDITTIGELTDREVEATALTAEMQNRINAVTDKAMGLRPEEKPRVFHICWHDPIYTSGQGTFVNDLFERAGGVNIFGDLQGWSMVNLETLIARDPEVIIVTAMGGTSSGTWEWINTEPRLADISARKNGRVHFVESNWVERPGPRIVLGLELIARYLHPEIFSAPSDSDEAGRSEAGGLNTGTIIAIVSVVVLVVAVALAFWKIRKRA